MLRRTCTALLRRTPKCLSDELYHPPKLADIPPASTVHGFFGAYNGPLSCLRLVDLRWCMNRAVDLGREHYIAAPIFYLFLWLFCWEGFVMMRYGDGAPPRKVDWNTEETGYLPAGFTPTQVKRIV